MDPPSEIEDKNWRKCFVFDEEKETTECTLCEKQISGNYKRHLVQKHPEMAIQFNCKIKRKTEAELKRINYKRYKQESDPETGESSDDEGPRRFHEMFTVDEDAGDDTSKCTVCKEQILGNQLKDKKQHILTHHPKLAKKWKLNLGDIAPTDDESWKKYFVPDASGNITCCTLCGCKIASAWTSNQKRHLKRKHPEAVPTEEWTRYFDHDEDEKISTCMLCSDEFRGKHTMIAKQHFTSHHPDMAAGIGCVMKRASKSEGSYNNKQKEDDDYWPDINGTIKNEPYTDSSINFVDCRPEKVSRIDKQGLKQHSTKVLIDPKFFWSVIEPRVGKVPQNLKGALDAIGYNTFSCWKGFNYRKLEVTEIIPRFEAVDEDLFEILSDRTGSLLNILYAIAEETKAVNHEQEIADDYINSKNQNG